MVNLINLLLEIEIIITKKNIKNNEAKELITKWIN